MRDGDLDLTLSVCMPTRLLCPWNSPGKNTEVGCHSLLQGIFPTRGSNPRLLHLQDCRRILYHWATWESLTFLRGQEILHSGGNTYRQTGGRRRWSSSRWGQCTVPGKAEAWDVQEEERVWCEFGERLCGREWWSVRLERTCMCARSLLSRLFVTLWTIAHQAPVHGFSRQEYWSGLPCPPPGDLPDPGIESRSLTSLMLAGAFFTMSSTLHVLLSYKDFCFVSQSQGLLKVDGNLELRVKWIGAWVPTFVLLWSWEMIQESALSSISRSGEGWGLAEGEGEPMGAQRLGWPFGVCHQGGLMFVLQKLHLSCPWGGAK